jgi:Domain of unknown function (DUF4340)
MNTNRRLTTALIVGGFAVALVLAAVFLLPKLEENKAANATSEPTEETLGPLFPDEQGVVVNHFRIVDNTTEVAVAANLGSDATSWTIEEAPKDANTGLGVDANAILTNVGPLPSIIPQRKLENVDDLAAFGLDKPLYTLEFTTTGDKTHKLEIGNKNPGGAAYYILVDGSPDVYLISTYYLDPTIGMAAKPPYIQPSPGPGTGTPDPFATP